MPLDEWLHDRVARLEELWLSEVRATGFGREVDLDRVVERYARRIVGALPLLIGPTRESIRPLWDRLTELYGVLAAKRGLAAGEAIEELHALRELVILDLYRDPPADEVVPLSLREVLRLNRGLDRAVVLVSVGHTDALFFEFFGGEREPGQLDRERVVGEAESQLDALVEEIESAVSAGGRGAPAVVEE